METFRFRLFIALMLEATAALFVAEGLAGTLRGHVASQEGKSPIVGVNVSLPGTRYGAISSPAGDYVIADVPAGTYTVRISMIGFDRYERNNVIIRGDSDVVVLDVLLSEEPVGMAEVVVRGRADRELESSGRRTEQQANNVINVISAQAIERSTDRTAADVLQRVPGMSLIRDQGEGRYVVMRGLEQRYNNTLVDGIKIPSPESKDRYVPMDIFPSSLFERIEVTKALTPDIAGDAIGGSTNMIMRNAPENFTFHFSTGAGFNSGLIGKSYSTIDRSTVPELDPARLHGVVSESDPTRLLGPPPATTKADFSVNNMKFSNRSAPPDGIYSLLLGDRMFDGRLGLLAAGSYQNSYNRVQAENYELGTNVNNHFIPFRSTYDNRLYGTNRTRGGAVLKADYILDVDQQLSAAYIYVRQDELQTRHGTQIEISGARGAADLFYTNRSALRMQNISNVTLSGSHFTTSPFSVRWTANYSDAVQDRPDEAEYTVEQNYGPDGKTLQNFQGLGGITHSWRTNDDQQYLGKIDATYALAQDGTQTVQAGIMAQKLNRVNFENDYNLTPVPVKLNGHFQTQPFTTIDSALTTPKDLYGDAVFGYQNYKADEILASSYLQYVLVLGSLQTLAGVRWEEARDTYFTAAPVSAGANQAKVTAVDFLPGIHFRYAFTPEHIARFSVTRTLSRPSYFDLVPATDRQDEREYNGNPNLRPAHSTNLDLRYEYYPNPSEQFSLGFYYKEITDPIVDSLNTAGVIFSTKKVNGDPAHVYGLEAVAVKRFGPLSIAANYSYVYSVTTTTKLLPGLDENGSPIIPVPTFQQKRPLESQSPQLANFSLTYFNEDWGTEANIAYNYTGRRLIAISAIDGWDTYEDAVGEVDFSADQRLIGNLKLSLKVTNLSNAPVVTETPSGDRTPHPTLVVQRQLNNIRGAISIGYRF